MFKNVPSPAENEQEKFGFSDSSTPWDGVVKSDRRGHYGATSSSSKDAVISVLSHTKSEQIMLTWDRIGVVLPEKRSFITRKVTTPAKSILKGASGVVEPGTLLAVMGSSGSGKTTLLNVLTSRNIDGLEILGDVKVNGSPVGRGITSMSAYVQQEDLFVGVLTVKEHLWFQAMLRMDSHFNDEERLLRVEEVLRELGLNKCKDTRIGMAGRVKAISGGERKRLAFASEVLTNPPLMFCDEPTSGLDSFMAENVVQTLRQMASRGKTVICTIHQPSSRVFELFDNLLLLAEGRVAYMGPTEGAKTFFAQHGFSCPEQFNPADFYIRTLALTPGRTEESRSRIDAICDGFQTQVDTLLKEDISQVSKRFDKAIFSPKIFDLQTRSVYRTKILKQFRLVFWRSWVTNNRDRSLNMIRLCQSFFTCLLAGLIYSGAGNDQMLVQNYNGVIYFLLGHISFMTAFSTVNVFPSELALFKRDHANGMYRTSVYYLSKVLVDVPIFLFIPVLATTLVYWLGGLITDASTYFVAVGTNMFLIQIVVSFGYFMSTLAGSVSTAVSLTVPVIFPFMLVGGFFVNVDSIPDFIGWIKYLSWFRYANEILIINQWSRVENLSCPTTNNTDCFKNGEDVIRSLNFDVNNLTQDFLVLLALFVCFWFSAYLCLLLRVQPLKFKKQ